MSVINYPVKRSTLAKVYKISDKTLITWLRDIGIEHSKTLTPAELKRIISHYDLPSDVEIKI